MFSCEFSKISRITFFRDCFCFQLLRSGHRRCSMNKGVLGNFVKFTGNLWFAKFSETPFLQNTSGGLLLAFSCNVTKMRYSVCETSLFRNTNLRSTVQVRHFFFRQDKLSVYVFIGLHCLLPEAAIRVEVFCKKKVLLIIS